MSAERQILLDSQDDAYQRLLAHAALATVSVVQVRRAFTGDQLKQLLSARTARGGKVGLCILVERPTFVPAADDPSLRGQLVQAFTVIEHPTLNAGDLGTRLSAEEVSMEILQLFAFIGVTRPQQAWSPFPGGAILPDDSFEGFNAWVVRLQTFVACPRDERCGLVLIEPEGGVVPQSVTLTTGTSGASIYYTLDGSYPSSANPAAVLYAGAINVTTAATLRAAAQKSALQQGGISQATFT